MLDGHTNWPNSGRRRRLDSCLMAFSVLPRLPIRLSPREPVGNKAHPGLQIVNVLLYACEMLSRDLVPEPSIVRYAVLVRHVDTTVRLKNSPARDPTRSKRHQNGPDL